MRGQTCGNQPRPVTSRLEPTSPAHTLELEPTSPGPRPTLSSSSPRPRPTLSSSSPRGAQGGAQRRCLSDGHMEERSPHSSLITAGSHIGS
jgi:hypothetical protein